MYKDNEGLVDRENTPVSFVNGPLDYSAPVDPSNPIYQEMMLVEADETRLIADIQKFNNASNLLYGWQRMPTL